LETINGYTIIASHQIRPDERVILGVRRRPRPDDSADVEYVTAHARLGEVTSWFWGHYFTAYGAESRAFLAAVDDFRDRAEITLKVTR
jgi:hypothetical protein